ncbi:hypothetical protein [Xylanibacter oryzae]|uniref:hypothetical protein n=1 Tax=Xylanibacter oryzae TaxID=185293 RepID=UPI0004B898B5|nr:hypothetical protein [Xylanibacter oryzae]
MENIILKSARLIATDDESIKIIERLRSEEVYGQENNEWQLMNIVLVSSTEGVENIPNVLSKDSPAKRTVIIKTNQSLVVDDDANYYSVLSFFNDADVYKEIKTLLFLIRINVEIYGLSGLDTNDFFTLTKGRKIISTVSYAYKDNIDEAFNELMKIKLQDNGKYLLFFTIEHYDSEGLAFDMLPVENFMNTFPKKATLYWNLSESSDKFVILFTSISI